jgi:phage tail sheath protein FI
LKWRAEVWGSRLAILPTDVLDNFLPANFTTVPAGLATRFRGNVNLYTVGIGGANIGQQTSALAVASDGTPPTAADYDDAYLIIDSQVDLFNLMVLPPDALVAMTSIYGKASVFCQERRAFLLMDPPSSWTSAQIASTGVAALRVGLVKDYSAIFFPRLTIDNNGLKLNIGPAGAIAGLCARTDGTRGVWKAPAGMESDLRGVIGLEQRFSDGENGILNPRAVNTIRIFPNGIVNWGARTMDGDDDFASEYKYIPIRRLALYIEESLYRGLKWVVFEPNDEPLYAQIRLNVGAFMHDLFRQGAFQGQKPSDAYFVKCDKETTTQNDRNLGIVNIWVGFAPLKPAEFVILYLQQMAGQIEV